jgi:hypothetical protein
MCNRVCSMATCCRRLISFESEIQRIEPAPRCLRISSIDCLMFSWNSGAGRPGSCDSCAIFSSRVICRSRRVALSRIWASVSELAEGALAPVVFAEPVCPASRTDGLKEIANAIQKYAQPLKIPGGLKLPPSASAATPFSCEYILALDLARCSGFSRSCTHGRCSVSANPFQKNHLGRIKFPSSL